MSRREHEGVGTAEGVASDDHLLAERPGRVGGEADHLVEQRTVRVDAAGPAVARLIDRHRATPVLGEAALHPPPRRRRVGEAVEEQDRGPVAVGLDDPGVATVEGRPALTQQHGGSVRTPGARARRGCPASPTHVARRLSIFTALTIFQSGTTPGPATSRTCTGAPSLTRPRSTSARPEASSRSSRISAGSLPPSVGRGRRSAVGQARAG